MSVGERRFRVTFQSATVSQDGFGEPDQTWSSLATAWALVQDIRGQERYNGAEIKAELTTRIVTRAQTALASLGPGDRATWSGHTYDIRAVIPRDFRRQELELLCTEHL